MVAHALARFALNVSNYKVWMEIVPSQIHSFVLANSNGLYWIKDTTLILKK